MHLSKWADWPQRFHALPLGPVWRRSPGSPHNALIPPATPSGKPTPLTKFGRWLFRASIVKAPCRQLRHSGGHRLRCRRGRRILLQVEVGGRLRPLAATRKPPAGTDDKARHALRLRQCTAAVLLEWRWAEQVAGKFDQRARYNVVSNGGT